MAVIRKPPTGSSSLKKIDRSAPPAQNTFTGQEFFSETEHKYNYVAHQVSGRYQPPKAPYVPNDSKLDGETNHHADYKAWPVTAPERHQHQKYQPNPAEFTTVESTSKADYGYKPLPPPARKVNHYHNSAKNMGFSTGSTNPSARNSMSNINGADAAAGSDAYQRNRAKFDGTSSQKADFQSWPTQLPTRHQHAKYVPNDHVIPTGTTTQKSDFTPKELGIHYIHPAQPYQQNVNPLDSITTHKASFLKWEVQQSPTKFKNVTVKPGQASMINIGHHEGSH